MIDDKQFQDVIGPYNGYTIWFDREKIGGNDTIPFYVSIDGKHDSTFVKITGKFYQNNKGRILYYKQDTLYKRL